MAAAAAALPVSVITARAAAADRVQGARAMTVVCQVGAVSVSPEGVVVRLDMVLVVAERQAPGRRLIRVLVEVVYRAI
jgi:hypothetical protein